MSESNDNDWRSIAFRQSMVGEIEKAVTTCELSTTKNALEIENQAFSRAKSRDEYMSFVASLIVEIKEQAAMKTGPSMAGKQNPTQDPRKFPLGNTGMPPGPSIMQPGVFGEAHSATRFSPNEPRGKQNQMINQENFMEQAQMQNVSSQLQQGQMQNSQMKNQQMENVLMQNIEMLNAQLQDHLKMVQMPDVPKRGKVVSASNDTDWGSSTCRQWMVEKIEQALMTSGAPTTRNAIEVENLLFSKSESRDEYVILAAIRLFRIKEIGAMKKGHEEPGQQNPAQESNEDEENQLTDQNRKKAVEVCGKEDLSLAIPADIIIKNLRPMVKQIVAEEIKASLTVAIEKGRKNGWIPKEEGKKTGDGSKVKNEKPGTSAIGKQVQNEGPNKRRDEGDSKPTPDARVPMSFPRKCILCSHAIKKAEDYEVHATEKHENDRLLKKKGDLMINECPVLKCTKKFLDSTEGRKHLQEFHGWCKKEPIKAAPRNEKEVTDEENEACTAD